MLDWFLWGLICGAWGYVFRVLQGSGYIFEWYGTWVEGLYQANPFIAKPLGWCPVCHAGQIALWSGLLGFIPHLYSPFCFLMEWNLIGHLASVVVALCASDVLSKKFG